MTTPTDDLTRWKREVSKLLLKLVVELHTLNPGLDLSGRDGCNLDPIIEAAEQLNAD